MRLDILSEDVLRRLVNEDRTRLVVSAYISDMGSARLEPVLGRLQNNLSTVEQQYSNFTLTISGLFVTSSRVGHRVIPELAASLGFAALVICLMVAIGLRSLKLGLISIVPNAFPILAVCAVMFFLAIPIQYITVLAFTVCLGIAVDDSIHYMYRYHLMVKKGIPVEQRLIQTSQQIGRALVITTIVIGVGMIVLLLSASRITQQFGLLSASAVVLALFADLVILVAMLKVFDSGK